MRMWPEKARWALAASLALTGCDDGAGEASPADSAPPPDASVDSGAPDALMADALMTDSGALDAEPMVADGSAPPPTQLGGDRPAALQSPPDHDGTPRPLIVALGGYDYFADDLDMWWGISAEAAAQGAWLLLPDGTVDQDGSPFWSATDTCCDFYETGVDDVAYLSGLIEEAQGRLPIDPRRIVLIGHSNGGFMAYRMACERADLVTALVSVAGSGWLDAERCQPSAPVSVLQAHGLLDDVMPFDGDADAPGALEMMARWGARDGCDMAGLTPTGEMLDLIDGDGVDTEVLSHSGCAEGADVRLWRMAEVDHYPEFTTEFVQRALFWALAHPRPE